MKVATARPGVAGTVGLLVAIAFLAACGSSSSSGSGVQATCAQISGVLSDGPDPGADPIGYAEAQILPLRQIHTSDKGLQEAIDQLDSAYQDVTTTNGGTAADAAVTTASAGVDKNLSGGDAVRRHVITGSAPMRNRWVKLTSAALGLVLSASMMAACGSSGSGQSITLYNGQHEQTTDSLVAGFEKATGIHVNVRNDDEDTFVNQILVEGSHSPADVFYTENSPPLVELQEKGLLSPVDPSTLSQTPSQYNSPDGDWEAVSARVSVLIYNPGLISPAQLPTSVLQMADPQYKGKLALAPGETDFQPIVTAVIQDEGIAAATKWLDGLKSNSSGHQYPDNETIADEVNRGAVAFGVVNQYYWYRMQAELGASNTHAMITYFAPRDPGYVIDVSGAGILKSSKHQAAAQEFLAYLTSNASQEIIAHSISFEYPLASGVSPTAPETPFGQLQPYPITIAQLGDGSSAISLMTKVGLL